MTTTPARERDFSIDLLRAGSIVGIVVGHWVVTGMAFTNGVLHTVSPLSYAPLLSPMSWVLQALAPFFFAAGYAAAASHPSAGQGAFRRARGVVLGLVRPLLLLLALWVAFLCTMFGLGLPLTNTRPVGALLVDPLWFIGVYLILTVVSPWLSSVGRRIGWWLPGLALVVVTASDLIQYLGSGELPGQTIATTVIAWTIPYVLGIWLREDEETSRRRVRGLVIGLVGLLGFVGALTLGPYPQSMVGVNGAEVSNLSPPSLAAVALGLLQIGVFLLLRPWIQRITWGRLIRLVAVLNRHAIPIYLLHQTALLVPTLISAAAIPLPGLVANAEGPFWFTLRLPMIPFLAGLLALLVWGLFGSTTRTAARAPDKPAHALDAGADDAVDRRS